MRHIHTISFKHAAEGLVVAFATQPNLRIHAFAAIAILLAAYYFSLSIIEWCLILFCIGQVTVAELINTAIEATTDLITQQHNHYAKIAKDVAAAAVLLSALMSFVIGALIFIPKII